MEGCIKGKMSNPRFWTSALASISARILLIYLPGSHVLSTRPEISNPLTSLRRLAEGYWLKQSSMSPYSGSMYHGSPLLLSALGPLIVRSFGGQPNHILCRLLFVVADLLTSVLIRKTGHKLQISYSRTLQSNDRTAAMCCGDIAALVYLWNPLSIAACVGSSTASLENFGTILSLYGAATGVVPLASLGWVTVTHLSLYPAVLIIPIILLLGCGLDGPQAKVFQQVKRCRLEERGFLWWPVIHFLSWSALFATCLLTLCSISLTSHGGLTEMFKSTYGFILGVEDLSPNMGITWYFFTEVFEFFRSFFLMLFHINVVFMMLPIAMRMHHRPLFVAFLYISIYSLFKTYPSVGDAALFCSLLCFFLNELSDVRFSSLLFCGYAGILLLSPVMHNLWIWRGTGNANFYFATAMIYAYLQVVLLVESVSGMVAHDRMLILSCQFPSRVSHY